MEVVLRILFFLDMTQHHQVISFQCFKETVPSPLRV